MKDKDLLAKRDAIRDAFDKQTQIKSEAESEQLRLQGEYRLIQELITLSSEKKSKDGKKNK